MKIYNTTPNTIAMLLDLAGTPGLIDDLHDRGYVFLHPMRCNQCCADIVTFLRRSRNYFIISCPSCNARQGVHA